MCYAVSKDGGVTWQTSTGKKYMIPINAKTAEYAWLIPQNSDLINQTSMTSDENDHPYIATYYQASTDSCPQYYVIYKQADQWKTTRATDRTLNFDLAGAGSRSIPVSRPQLLFAHNGDHKTLHLLFRDDEHQGRVCMATSTLSNMSWKTTELTRYSLDRWEPSYDTELWKKEGKLNIFIQKVGQESGEKAVAMEPQVVSILEIPIK
jgi:hypothetical protein